MSENVFRRESTRAGKMEPSYPLRTTRCIPQEKLLRKPYNNPLLAKFVRSRWLDIGLVLFCEILFVSVQEQEKSELGHYSAIFTSHVNLCFSFFNTSSWCAAPTSDPSRQHLQVDLLTIHYVSAVSTQGAVTENSWVSSYLVHYSLDGKEWIVLTDKGGEIKVCFSTVRILQKLH